MRELLEPLIFAAGFCQLAVLIASALVPVRLNWKADLAVLPKLHRQLYWVYGGYVVLGISALGLISILNAGELARGSLLARSVCAYITLFWGIRLLLQAWLDAGPHLTEWWLKAGYHLLTVFFVCFTVLFALATFWP